MKKFLGLICLLYSGIIIYTLYTKTLSNYLAPNMHIYIIMALVLLIIMGVLIIIYNANYKFKITDLILLLPLLAIFLSNDGRLTATFASNRMATNRQNIKNVEVKEEIVPEEIKEDNEYDFTNVDYDVIDESYDELANYITFHPYAKKYTGKTIRVRGFVVTKDSFIPTGYFLIGKYSVNCCAADSTYIPFFARYDGEVNENGWYEIEGVLEVLPDNEYDFIMGIKVINIKPIDSKKEELYVYPCYSYGDGTCKETEKYKLEY